MSGGYVEVRFNKDKVQLLGQLASLRLLLRKLSQEGQENGHITSSQSGDDWVCADALWVEKLPWMYSNSHAEHTHKLNGGKGKVFCPMGTKGCLISKIALCIYKKKSFSRLNLRKSMPLPTCFVFRFPSNLYTMLHY